MRFKARVLVCALLGVFAVASTLVAAPTAGAEETVDLWLTRFEGSGPPEYQYRAFNGQTVYFIVDATNRGPATATGVAIVVELPVELSYDASRSDSRCSSSGTTVTCAIGSVAPWEQVNVLVYTTATAAGTFVSTATIAGNEADALPADNSASTSVTVNPSADVAVAIGESADPARSREPVTYTVELTNHGPDAATSGRLNVNWQPFGPEATLISFASTNELACFQSFFNHIDCDFATLAPGATATLTLVLSFEGKGTVEMRATAIAAEFDPVANQEPVETTTVVRRRVR